MIKTWFLVGVTLLLVSLLLLGCGISEQEYNAVVAERNSIKAELESTRSELEAVKSELASVYVELTMTKTELQVLKDQVSRHKEAPLPPPVPAPLPPPAPVPLPAPTEVITIDIGWPMAKNWDADMEIDGIEFYLTPKDAEGRTVETAGMVSTKLWLERSFLEGGGKGELIQEWSDTQVTKDDYDWLMGATIRLEYKGFQPKNMQFGILEITLITPDGKSFSARATSVMLGQ